MSNELTPTDNQPPPKPPAIPGRIPQSPPDKARVPNLDKRVESLKQDVASILKNTDWPPDSTAAAEGLLNTINLSPKISENMKGMPHELLILVRRFIQILEDVRIRLRDASSKSEIKRWKFLERIKSLTSNRPSKCTLLFQTCQDDVAKVISALNDRLDYEHVEEPTNSLGSPSHFQPQSFALGPVTSIPEEGTTVDDSAPKPLPRRRAQSIDANDRKTKSPMSDSALTVARKTLKSVEIGSGAIPVVGSYVGAVAKVGLAFVEMIQTMDRNNSLAIDLGDHTSNLTKLLESIKERSTGDEQDIIGQIKDLHRELGQVGDRVEGWSSLGRFRKAFSAHDHAKTLEAYQGTIQKAREEIQLLVSIESRNIIVELENMELRKERDRLLTCLGDGQYGGRGNMIEDIICFPGTRLDVLERLGSWIRDTAPSNRVLWISGMAGRGKSTIASTVVHNWKCRASCAIFHFRRGQNTVNSRVICALARQLGTGLVSEVREAVLESVRENESIAGPGQRLDEQFETLLVAPFAKLKNHLHPILVVLDALDECDNPKDAVDLIRLVHKHSSSFPANVKFLLTCRPEDPIRRQLDSKQWPKEDLDLAPGINNDLARFIQHACTQIRDDHDLSEDWPSSEDVEQLVQMSQGLFQWARTAVTYIGNGSPEDRLWALLERPSVWSGLDDLYHQILSKAFDNVRLDPVRQDILRRVLGTLVVAPLPVSLEVIATLYSTHEIFNGTKQGRLIPFLRKDVLADLNSLLFIPESSAEPIRLMHTSIHDLLSSELRCRHQPFYVEPARCHQQLAVVCFEIMLEGLKENMCNLSDFSKPSSDLQGIVEQEVSKGIQYCCRAWFTHLTQGVERPESGESETTPVGTYLKLFSEEKIAYWLEVMSLVGATAEAITAAMQVHQWLIQLPKHESLASLWGDVQRFVTTFLEPISFGPLHIYNSALPHCPKETQIWDLYGKHAKVRLLQGYRMSTWPSSLWTRSSDAMAKTVTFSPDGLLLAFGSENCTVQLLDAQRGTTAGEPLTGHCDTVWSVCFSPNGKLLASASDDGTVRLWNSKTGVALGEPLSGHTGGLRCVCFSPNGKLLASGSVDKMVRLWNAETGAPVGEPLGGHSGEVISVCFSPDGKLVASGSADTTIRFWDPKTGAALGEPLMGHSNVVRSVCFSPNGTLLVSGADDNTIRLWAIETRTQVGKQLNGHNGGVNSVCFSPDGKLLASGSDDETIRLWNTETGAALGEPLTGHSARVWSVCFSPDGKLLASGSDDETVRLWDPQAGAAPVAESPNNQSAKVNSVYFSPNGKCVASVYDDHTIRLWDPQAGAAVGEPLTGHIHEVNSVCFSSNGKLLASGSNDETIRLWDAQTGVAAGEPLRASGLCVWSVCFSPDGRYLASGSYKTIQLWDPHTGVQVGEPLTGHRHWVRSVCFSPDGKYLASGSEDKTIRLWDPKTGVAVGEPLAGHSGYVIFVSFSPDGSLILARCDDGSVVTWDVTTCQRCYTPRSHPFYTNPRFQNHWITFGSSRFLWLPPQYWNSDIDGVALFGGHIAAFQNGTLSILDVSQVRGTLTD